MKIRNGFVSNSSSSSFVICLPENFDINSIDFELVSKQIYYGSSPEEIRNTFQKLINEGGLSEWDGDNIYGASEVLKHYIIATLDGSSSGEGQIILVDINLVKKIINNEN